MKTLYVTSIENFSGKTAITLGLGRRLQVDGHTVGYYKPVSYDPVGFAETVIDEDVTFAHNVLSLELSPGDLYGALISARNLSNCLGKDDPCGNRQKIKEGSAKAGEDKDILLLEGGGSLRQGYAIGLSTPYVAEMLDAKVLAVVKFRGRTRVLDDALTAQFRLQDRLLGIIINRVPEEELPFIGETAIPFLQENGIEVLGVLPERPNLAAITVGEIADTLEAQFLLGDDEQDRLVKEIVVGAMGAREALSRFRLLPDKAVITGGDRTDVQLAALETSTACLVLTGNLSPSLNVIERAESMNVPILISRHSTIGAVEAVDNVFGKTRLGQAEKLAFFEALMAEHVNFKRIEELLGL